MLAAAWLITNRTERGELAKAHADAEALVKRQPDSGDAHFALSVVLRYIGMLEESAHQCEAAQALDPANFEFRSCAFPFSELGTTGRAMEFVHLDRNGPQTLRPSFSCAKASSPKHGRA
jgi:hypothetical protein